MNKSDLLRAVAAKTGLGAKDTEAVVDAFLDVVALSLTLDEDVSVRNFGKFEVRHHNAVIRRNPKTGERIDVPAKRAVGFKPSPRLKGRVNGQPA